MQARNSLSEAIPILIGTFFIVTPIVVLFAMNCEHQRIPADDYMRAVHEAMNPDHVSHSLVSVNLDQPVTVVTWTRKNQIQDYKGNTTPSYKNTWVTVVPWLKSFCQNYMKSHVADAGELNLRLEERLGLPQNSGYDSFVELTVDNPKDVSRFFRPCKDPSPGSSNTCEPFLLSKKEPEEMKEKIKVLDLKNNDNEVENYWLLSRYYRSYASSTQYPWTALGYTFDWAPKEDGSGDLVRWGESEFVISPGTPIHFVSAIGTAAYCTPQ